MRPPASLQLTWHATRRCHEMGVSPRAAERTVRHAEIDYPSSYPDSSCRLAARGRLVVVYDPDERRIITVLWRGKLDREEVDDVRVV